MLLNEIKKYKTLKEFSLNSVGAYLHCIRNKKFIKEMDEIREVRREWNDETVLEKIKKYKTLKDLIKHSASAHAYCLKNKKFELELNNIRKKKLKLD